MQEQPAAELKYVVRFPDGREEGPLGTTVLLDMARRGVVPLQSSVRREHGTSWVILNKAFPGVNLGASGESEHTPMPIIVGGGGLYAVLDGNSPVTAKDAVNAGSFLFGTVFLVIGGVTVLLFLGLLLAGLGTPIQAVVGLIIGALFLFLGVRRFGAIRNPRRP